MNVLALNPGSSTLKFALYDDHELITKGVVEVTEGMGKAAAAVIARQTVDAVGCRVVHGGSRFVTPVLVDDAVLDEIRALVPLAPLHNPLAIEVLSEARRALPSASLVAVFDTAFHQTLPAVASTYAVPRTLGVRRYGFHGISHGYIASRLRRPRLISCHLGNGASVCAIRDGKSVDTSMGLTPMEGLVMGTRSGDVDPGLVLYLLRRGMSVDEVDHLLNHESGLLGLSGVSGDMRTLEKEGAEPAMDVFAYRVAKYIGAYAAALEGLDAVAFTGGIGEHSSSMRRRICARLRFLGIVLDEASNAAVKGEEARISAGDAAVEVWVVPTDEEAEVARATLIVARAG
ncbi:MAG: acetate/propionate family kinase [Acidobacteriota bacterium]